MSSLTPFVPFFVSVSKSKFKSKFIIIVIAFWFKFLFKFLFTFKVNFVVSQFCLKPFSVFQAWSVCKYLYNQLSLSHLLLISNFSCTSHILLSLSYFSLCPSPFYPSPSLIPPNIPFSNFYLTFAAADLAMCPFFLFFFCLWQILYFYLFPLPLNSIQGADFIWTIPVPCPILFNLNASVCLLSYFFRPNYWEKLLPSPCTCAIWLKLHLCRCFFAMCYSLTPTSTLLPWLNKILQNQKIKIMLILGDKYSLFEGKWSLFDLSDHSGEHWWGFWDTSTNPPKNLGMGQTPPPFWQCQDFHCFCYRNPSLSAGTF